jgi:hypothetical protein
LKGVVAVQIGGQEFSPVAEGSNDSTMKLEAKAGVSPKEGSEAEVKLKDGRVLKVKVSTAAARPGLQLIQFTATAADEPGTIPVTLGGKDDIPLDGNLVFVVKTNEVFPRNQTIEVATADGSVKTTLSIEKNTLILQDEHTAVGTLNPLKAFGESAFGRLAMRPVAADGTPGDWTALGVLVRTPKLTGIQCTTADAPSCTAKGDHFFLVEAFSGAKDFSKPVEVPSGYADGSFAVPTPADGATLYVKLRDDPSQVAVVSLPVPLVKAAPSTKAASSAGPVQMPVSPQ